MNEFPVLAWHHLENFAFLISEKIKLNKTQEFSAIEYILYNT